jgi:hypothetical protein
LVFVNDEVANQLKVLIKQYGTALCDDPKRCQALLMDLCCEYVKEIRVLHTALESDVPRNLLASNNIPFELSCTQLTLRLVNEYALAEEAALWSVEAWAFALELRNTFPQKTVNRAQKQDDSASQERQPFLTTAGSVMAKPAPRYAGLNADYYIDYEKGTTPLSDLPIGARVVDSTWVWEFRTGDDYTGSGAVKPVVWVVVAKDHYEGLNPHVTLQTEELIGKFLFDNSTNRNHIDAEGGYNHWGESGTGNASKGLRPWLNSIGIHSGEGFYRVFSDSFKGAVITTTVPNKEWEKGSFYSTQDRVFIPSTAEMSYHEVNQAYQVGTTYSYYHEGGSAKRVARLGGEITWYWTRSPESHESIIFARGNIVRIVDYAGEFNNYFANGGDYVGRSVDFDGEVVVASVFDNCFGVRPVLNLKAEILVSEIR